MTVPPLISAGELRERLGDPTLVVADVRWAASPPPTCRELFASGHVPGAVYLDLDDDLSDRSDPMRGRHPLPDPVVFVGRLAALGIGRGSEVVCCDDAGGAIAGRLYWMLRHWLGHEKTRLLDGGLDAWRMSGGAIETGAMNPGAALEPIATETRAGSWVEMDEVRAHVERGGVLVDARNPMRYAGEFETIDPVGGHIPGAVNAFHQENLVTPPGGTRAPVFRSAEELRGRLGALTNGYGTVVSCGSGVTACVHVVAFDVAGLPAPALYVGSWSEWCRNGGENGAS